jgi:DNA polymerase III alpha subunit
MVKDKFGNVIYQQHDLVELIYQGFTALDSITVESFDKLDKFEEQSNLKLKTPNAVLDNFSIEEYDQACQNDWFIPEEYKNFDIEEFLVNACPQQNYQRLIEELEEYKSRNMMMLLKTLKYLIDTLRVNNIVWGVGRGSSVASYVLFLLEVHRIDSVKYNLDWREFLR